jgi:hypothetical protein
MELERQFRELRTVTDQKEIKLHQENISLMESFQEIMTTNLRVVRITTANKKL